MHAAPSEPRPVVGTPQRSAPAGPHQTSLRYTQAAYVVVEGPVTRRRYEFSAGSPIRAVESADAARLLATRFFEQT